MRKEIKYSGKQIVTYTFSNLEVTRALEEKHNICRVSLPKVTTDKHGNISLVYTYYLDKDGS